MFGKLMHFTFDAILISAVLAGIRRSTGLELALTQAPKDARSLLKQYLDIGDWTLDLAIVVMGRSRYFERKR